MGSARDGYVMRRYKTASLGLIAIWCILFVSGPIGVKAQSPSPAPVAINKVQGATWRPDLGQPLFILVLGSDARNGPVDGGRGRCDAIHILAINSQAKRGSIINFPRDSFINVPGHGENRINTACFFGGPELMVETVKQLTGIPIHFYAITEFTHFRSLIDELGGVDIVVPYPMRDPVGSGADFDTGPTHLLGEHALRFARNRNATPNGDFSRTENQAALMLACLQKFKAETQDQSEMLRYIRIARRNIQTTIPLVDMIKLGLLARDIDPAAIQSSTVPGQSGKAGSASVVFIEPGDLFARVRDDGIL